MDGVPKLNISYLVRPEVAITMSLHSIWLLIDFGELISTTYGASNGIISDGTRGFNAGGSTPSYTNVINQIIFQTLGNATDFGNQLDSKATYGGCSNETRGVFGGGNPEASSSKTDGIDYITIASTGN